MTQNRTVTVSREQEVQVILAVMNGHRSITSIASATNLTPKQVETAIAQLNTESMAKYAKPFVEKQK